MLYVVSRPINGRLGRFESEEGFRHRKWGLSKNDGKQGVDEGRTIEKGGEGLEVECPSDSPSEHAEQLSGDGASLGGGNPPQ